jgi:hypothetical protein
MKNKQIAVTINKVKIAASFSKAQIDAIDACRKHMSVKRFMRAAIAEELQRRGYTLDELETASDGGEPLVLEAQGKSDFLRQAIATKLKKHGCFWVEDLPGWGGARRTGAYPIPANPLPLEND